jgi:hypothetical protein
MARRREIAPLNVKNMSYLRALIDVKGIITKLDRHIKGLSEMSQTQIAAAKLLLGKAMPDLVGMQLQSQHTETVRYVEVPRKAESVEAWMSDHADRLIDITPASDKVN